MGSIKLVILFVFIFFVLVGSEPGNFDPNTVNIILPKIQDAIKPCKPDALKLTQICINAWVSMYNQGSVTPHDGCCGAVKAISCVKGVINKQCDGDAKQNALNTVDNFANTEKEQKCPGYTYENGVCNGGTIITPTIVLVSVLCLIFQSIISVF